MISYRPVIVRPRPRLAQAGPPLTKIVVTDMRGRPVPGAFISTGSVQNTAITDSSGRALINLGSAESTDVTVSAGGYTHTATVNAGGPNDVFVNLPICLAQPILTVPEMGSLAAAVLITAAGYYWKIEPAKVTGEVLFGATVFTAIYRLSCL